MADAGYCKPPEKSQFKPGVSGNPKGRPKRKPAPLAEIIRGILNTPAGRLGKGSRKVATFHQMAVQSLIDHALKGDLGAAEMILKVRASAERYGNAGVDWLEIRDWLPDYPGQTADQKSQEFAGACDADPAAWWEEPKATKRSPENSEDKGRDRRRRRRR